MGKVSTYKHDYVLGRLRAETHKALRSRDIGLYDLINMPQQKVGVYSGRFTIHTDEKALDIYYYDADQEAKAIKSLPDTLKIEGLEYSVRYVATAREKIASEADIKDSYERAKKKK